MIRFNDAPTESFEQFVGNKTSFRIQNLDFCGYTNRWVYVCFLVGLTTLGLRVDASQNVRTVQAKQLYSVESQTTASRGICHFVSEFSQEVVYDIDF